MVDEVITEFYDKDFHYGYDYVYNTDYAPCNDAEFMLHNHTNRYEIFLFLTGNAQFHVEGNIYNSHPHDLYIVNPQEMHHNVFLSNDRYMRVVIHLYLDFFEKNNCPELKHIFWNRPLGVNAQIPAHIVDREMYGLIMKMNRYLQERAYQTANCVLLELLYLLNRVHEPLTIPTPADKRIQDILLYINEHLTENLSLDHLATIFFINKYHLCKIFKSITGYTINHYITYKRLLLVRELHDKGASLLEASTNAGFNSYAHFYKMYKREFGTNPRNQKPIQITSTE